MFGFWQSLRSRVVVLSGAWTLIAVALLAVFLINQYRRSAEQGFHDLQQAQLYNLIAAVSLGPDGKLTGAPNLGDTSFLEAGSGWYWLVRVIAPASDDALASPSLGDARLATPTLEDVPYEPGFTRNFTITGPQANRLRVIETEVQIGEGGEIALFQLAGNQGEFDAAVSGLARNLAVLLGIFGAGLIAITGAIVVFAMRPLDRIREGLAAIHDGTSSSIDGTFPVEVQPMVDEMNGLIGNNRKVVERARTQVGNLAHSLKTPLAVLANEAAAGRSVSAGLVQQQVAAMHQQVDHYLTRARIAAQSGGTAFRTETGPVLTRLVSVMQKLNRHLAVTADFSGPAPVFAGEQEDIEEMCGNLLENACKWASSRVHLVVAADDGDPAGRFLVHVDDDGPGIPADRHDEALRRGRRLDETKPGTGLGLSIVRETAEAYGGSIRLGTSPLGGLRASLALPRARSS